MLHKLGKSKSLSLAQNYLILSMPLGRSFVFWSFLQNVGLIRVYFRYSGLVFDSHHVHFRCSGPVVHSRCSGPVIHSCCSVPALKRSHHTHPRYSVPFGCLHLCIVIIIVQHNNPKTMKMTWRIWHLLMTHHILTMTTVMIGDGKMTWNWMLLNYGYDNKIDEYIGKVIWYLLIHDILYFFEHVHLVQ